jgi:hypothetical protein
MSDHKPLDAQFVGQINADAMKAIGDTKARQKWSDSKSGSPVVTNMLCAEIARLNMALQKYGAHEPECGLPCDCGLDAALGQ